eukprot:978346-Amphidinium_carterae.3
MDKIAVVNAWSDIKPLNRTGMTHADYATSQVETTWYMVLRRCDYLRWNHEDGEYGREFFALCVKATTARLLEFEDETVSTTLYVRRGEDVSVELHSNPEQDAIHLKARVDNVFMTLHFSGLHKPCFCQTLLLSP